ncbi:MAG: hypothetical protein M3N42_18425 [Cyanobacteriota bacterium]|nr:hypothetical protein [Cyanobacteriota bacterium]
MREFGDWLSVATGEQPYAMHFYCFVTRNQSVASSSWPSLKERGRAIG